MQNKISNLEFIELKVKVVYSAGNFLTEVVGRFSVSDITNFK